MASKMLMGDMPELMENILKHLNNEIHSLYSCALVNRHWVLAKNTTKISALRLVFHSEYESKLCHTLFPALIRFIKSQEQLRKFILDGDDCPTEFYSIISALESQKNSLQEVTLEDCIFSEEFELINNCKNLETLHILDCDTELLKILDYNISTLEISHYDVPPIVQILEKTGILLQRLKIKTVIVTWEETLLLKAIKSFCPNIIYLYIKDIGLSTQFLEIIGNLQKLQFLSVGHAYHILNIPKEERKIRVMQFARILPSTLQYLDIALGILDTLLDSFIDILLDHCNVPLKKLLIGSGNLNNEKNTKALIRYCSRIRTLNYVGIVKDYDLGDDIRNELEKYVTLVPYKQVVVNC
ncbi:hypothetical protein F8M41_004307 [Gigaspora margarita]|uniref:F-box domain-containing protein n=1 Tax=Gigaspora margarita TaxID=4874 RepID=A0A8H4AXT7_GIGMA|nr:hypothetical protein F8M41_004307 [Gigaspora margarita]